ncbi:sodium:calcium antiporter [Parvularcula flava]|uniref:Sodium:calcium antiporter n=1 Tax=Aquisalinus luteolus TaxID=1566827 RepID=A0A8J3ENX5_9PROT|nr:sodium:calcium antiporter [Aquisalinus luteolus]NHK26407.1 sodium:calcium antiporter [Aquisalinus luteolus]GGH92244.1 hypothetical protein GCM10011355_01280 [Aquisalinus luteolus]
MPGFSSFSLAVNIAVFAVAAGIVGYAGTKIAKYADAISERTGLGEAVIGLFLLAGVTSLPEIATSFTAASSGNAPLAVNNLLGSIAMQIAVLAVGDLVYGKRALTSIVPDPVVILQGALNVVLLSVVAFAVMIGDVSVLFAGAWTWGLLVAAIYSFYKLAEGRGREPWVPNDEDHEQLHGLSMPGTDDGNVVLGVKTVASALAILIAGFIVSRAGETISVQSGLGSSFMGVAFVAIATSLPELSTVFAAMRRNLYTMAISDILGTNILNISLLLGVDAVSPGGPVLDRVGVFAAAVALLGVVLTGLFLVGLAERRDRTVWRMGVDSLLVLVCYAGGLAFLFMMRCEG